jgi:hypothetical protein
MVAVAAASPACGFGADDDRARPTSRKATLPVEGGSLRFAGVTLRLPARAAATPAGVRIRLLPAAGISPPPFARPLRRPVEVTVEAPLARPATLSFALPPGQDPRLAFIARFDERSSRWLPAGGRPSADRSVVRVKTRRFSRWALFGYEPEEIWAALRKTAVDVARFVDVRAGEPRCERGDLSADAVAVDADPADDMPIYVCIERRRPDGFRVKLVNNRTFMTAVALPPRAEEVRVEGGDLVERMIARGLTATGDAALHAEGEMTFELPESAASPVELRTRPRSDLLLYTLMPQALLDLDQRVEDVASFVLCAHALSETSSDDDDFGGYLSLVKSSLNRCAARWFPTLANGMVKVLVVGFQAVVPLLESGGLWTNPHAVRAFARITLPAVPLGDYAAILETSCLRMNREVRTLEAAAGPIAEDDYPAVAARLEGLVPIMETFAARLRPLRPPPAVASFHGGLLKAVARLDRTIEEDLVELRRPAPDEQAILEILLTTLRDLGVIGREMGDLPAALNDVDCGQGRLGDRVERSTG